MAHRWASPLSPPPLPREAECDIAVTFGSGRREKPWITARSRTRGNWTRGCVQPSRVPSSGMKSRRITVGDRAWTVRVDGPESRHSVLLLPDAGDPVDVYDQVCARLHTSDLRTIAVESVSDLD